jgi:hypothetical protein
MLVSKKNAKALFKQWWAQKMRSIDACSLMQVAISCTRLLPRERMNMKEVAAYLHSIRRSYVAAIKQEQSHALLGLM